MISNANLQGTIFNLVGPEALDADFVEQARAVRLNNSSTQVYMALRPGEIARRGDLRRPAVQLHGPAFRTDCCSSRNITSRTLLVLLSQDAARPGPLLIVASTNAHYRDWAGLPPEEYQAGKRELIEIDAGRRWRSTCPTSAASWPGSRPPRR